MIEATQNWQSERGAALILALLVMLVLSGLGLVALHATTTSASLSSMQQLRIQANSFSAAINKLGVARGGHQASAYRDHIHTLQDEPLHADDPDPPSNEYEQDSIRRRGGLVLFGSDTDAYSDQIVADDALHPIQTAGGGTGQPLLDGNGFVGAVETRHDMNYSYIVRDLMSGPRVQGFGDDFCFLVVTIGSHANLGGVTLEDDGEAAEERARRPQALGRHVKRTMLGPVECSG